MQTIDVYIGTSLRGRASGTGRVMYVMWSVSPSGKEHKSDPEVAEFDDATESSLVLLAVRDAISRINYAHRVVIHTECNYVAAAINQNWMEKWQKNNWKNSKEKEVKDAELWSMIFQEIEDSGNLLESETGKHEWSAWMKWQIPLTKPLKNTFKKAEQYLQN